VSCEYRMTGRRSIRLLFIAVVSCDLVADPVACSVATYR
jgi:hypothetical protein